MAIGRNKSACCPCMATPAPLGERVLGPWTMPSPASSLLALAKHSTSALPHHSRCELGPWVAAALRLYGAAPAPAHPEQGCTLYPPPYSCNLALPYVDCIQTILSELHPSAAATKAKKRPQVYTMPAPLAKGELSSCISAVFPHISIACSPTCALTLALSYLTPSS